MKTMTGKTMAILGTIAFSALSSPVFAAAEARKDNSSLVTLIFLGFCALIVLAQVLPAIRSAQEAAREERERRTAGNSTESAHRD
jgi:ABC-type enterobactin transport system permease subunit